MAAARWAESARGADRRLNDDAENIARSGEFASSLDGVGQIDILPYNRAAQGKLARLTRRYELLEVRPPSEERLQAIVGRLEDFGFAVKIGG